MIKKLICAAALLMVAGLQHTRAQYVYGTLSYSSGDGSWSGWKKCRPVQNNMTVRMKIHTGSQFTFRITLL